ncbi:MAG TPA: SgcJ/EcaC family oxidoreductase [Pseudonocardiaceae bacterium]
MPDTDIVARVLDGWQRAIDQHRPEEVAGYFTEDALFQGAHPDYTIGRAGVAEYYASQPVGMTVRYAIREVRPLADGVLSAYVNPEFTLPGGEVLRFHLTVILVRQDGGDWLISHYHVSRLA